MRDLGLDSRLRKSEALDCQRRRRHEILVMLTRACMFRCSYCLVRKHAKAISWKHLRAAVDLLLTSGHEDLELSYFGGEPLLRYDLIQRAVRYAEKRRARGSKPIRHFIMTNGFLLDKRKISWLAKHDVEISFSLDGSAETHRTSRRALAKGDAHARLLENLKDLQRVKIPYCVAMVVMPGNVERARENWELLDSWGVDNVEIGYQVGVKWSAVQKKKFLEFLAETARPRARMELQNFKGSCYFPMLNNDIVVDTDGGLYLGTAIFLEKKFPKFRRKLRLGSLDRARRVEELSRSRAEILRLMQECYPAGTRERGLLLNNLDLEMGMMRLGTKLSARGPAGRRS